MVSSESAARQPSSPSSAEGSWRRGRRASVNRGLAALAAMLPVFASWGLLWAAWGGAPGVNEREDWDVPLTGLAFGFAYLLSTGWWLDHLVAQRGGRAALVAHATAVAVLSSPWLLTDRSPEGPPQVMVNVLAVSTLVLIAATVEGSFPGDASRAPGGVGASSGYRRRRAVTFARWAIGVQVAGLGYGVTVVLWRLMDGDYNERGGISIITPPILLSVAVALYLLFVVWWVDHRLASRGRLGALRFHCALAAVLGLPSLWLGSHGEGLVVYLCLQATTVGAVALAGLVPGSFASDAVSRSSADVDE